MIVVDVSALVDALGKRPGVQARLADEELHAPHLVDVEVARALRIMLRRQSLTLDRASAALADLGQIEMQRHAHTDLPRRVWELRNNVTVYDALYIALAEKLDCPLVTLDARLGAAPGHRITVEVLARR